MPKANKKISNAKAKKSRISHGSNKVIDEKEARLRAVSIEKMKVSECSSVNKRISTAEISTNKVVKQIMKNMGYPPVYEFKYNFKMENILEFINKWKGCKKKNITSADEYYEKGISWLNGRRSPIYGKTLFPEMVENAVAYCKKIAKLTHPNDKSSRICLEGLLSVSVILELCRAKVYTKMAGEKPLFCQNAFKVKLGETIVTLVPSIGVKGNLDYTQLEEILKGHEQVLTCKYNNLRHNLRNDIETIHVSYAEAQIIEEIVSDANPIDRNCDSNDDVDSVVDEEENEDAEKEEQQKSKKNGKQHTQHIQKLEDEVKILRGQLYLTEQELLNQVLLKQELLKQDKLFQQSFCPSISSPPNSLHYNSLSTINLNDQLCGPNTIGTIPRFNTPLPNNLSPLNSFLYPLPTSGNEQEHDINTNMMLSSRSQNFASNDLISPQLNLPHYYPFSSFPNNNLTSQNKMTLSPHQSNVAMDLVSDHQPQFEDIPRPLSPPSPQYPFLDPDNSIYDDRSFATNLNSITPLPAGFLQEINDHDFPSLFNEDEAVQPQQNLGDLSMPDFEMEEILNFK